MKKQKGITLIALVITIIVLLVLAAVSINTLTSEGGLIKKSQESKFKMEASSYKEKAYIKGGGSSKQQIVVNSNDIYILRENFKIQITDLNKGIINAENGIAMIQTAEGALTETHSILQRMNELVTQATNGIDESINAVINDELQQLKEEIDRISTTVKFNGTKLLNGTLNTNIELGSETFEQGSIQVSINSMSWKAIYGSEEIDILTSENAKNAQKNIEKAITKVSEERAKLGAKQNRLEHTINYLKNMSENLLLLMNSIYGGTTDSSSIKYNYITIDKTLAQDAYWPEDGISLIQTAEGALNETYSMLYKMDELLTTIINGNMAMTDITVLKTEMEQLKEGITSIANETSFNGKVLLNGTLNTTIQLGATPEDGNFILNISKMDWEGVYGSEQIDYSNLQKIKNAIEKVSTESSKLSAIQNRLEHSINLMDNLIENSKYIESTTNDDIFYSGSFEKETAIEKANSWNTTMCFIQTSNDTLNEVHSMLQRINELSVQAANGTNDEQDRKAIQSEVDELVDEIGRQLKYCTIIDKNLLQGDLQYFDKIDNAKLKIRDLSVLTANDARKTSQSVKDAIDYISSIRQLLGNKKNELSKIENAETAKADSSYAFDVKTEVADGIIDQYINEKFSIINGVLYYTGNDEQEKKWAEELDIAIK